MDGLSRPLSKVTSLYSGVVKEVHVLEGQQIKKGEVIATLIDEDARLVLAEMNAKHSQSIAEEAIIEADPQLANAGLEAALSGVSKDEALYRKTTIPWIECLLFLGVQFRNKLLPAKLGLKRQRAELSSSNSEVSQQKALIKNLEPSLPKRKRRSFQFKNKKLNSILKEPR